MNKKLQDENRVINDAGFKHQDPIKKKFRLYIFARFKLLYRYILPRKKKRGIFKILFKRMKKKGSAL